MSNKEMLHRKQYRIAAVVAGLALAVSMTACGAQKGTEGTESVETMENVDPVVPESVAASVETTKAINMLQQKMRKTQRNSVEKRWRKRLCRKGRRIVQNMKW